MEEETIGYEMNCNFESFRSETNVGINDVSENICLPLPMVSNDIRKYFEGSSSIIKILPTPKIYRDELTGCAYVLPSDVFELYLPYGLFACAKTDQEFHDIQMAAFKSKTVQSIWECRHAGYSLSQIGVGEKVHEDKIKHKTIFFTEWSDGTDPNGKNKGNRGSMNVMSLSLFSDIHKNDERNTFVRLLC